MRARKHWLQGTCGLVILLTIPFTIGLSQDRPSAGREDELPDLSKLHPLHRAVYLSSRRGAEWLWQANRPDGLFTHGLVPALNVELEGDHYLRQAGATLALAKAARFTGSTRYAVRARQAVLALLASTKTDPADPGARFTMFPASEVNRLAAAALLALAIQELPDPGQDVLEQAEQLCQFLARQQQADGSWKPIDTPSSPEQEAAAPQAPAMAVLALIRSQAIRPGDGKKQAIDKGLVHCRTTWNRQKDLVVAAWLATAATDAYLLSQDKQHADFAFELVDWLCGLQFAADPRQPLWQGGFARWLAGKAVAVAPDVESARLAEAIAHTCRAARKAGDVQRYERYREAAERTLQFLTTLQYSTGNTRHFAESYRPQLLGAFHASHQDGTVRVDYTQFAVCAMIDYLESVAQLGPQARGPVR
jgi:hypothetical protein